MIESFLQNNMTDHITTLLTIVFILDVAIDWSDHALWWPKKNMWLCRTRSTLDQCGIQADALLHFTPMHKYLKLQLPDLRFIDIKADFSAKTFTAVKKLCKELGMCSFCASKMLYFVLVKCGGILVGYE